MTVLSLVSAPVLGFDLTRHPHGTDLARLLLHGIALDATDLAAPAPTHRDGCAPGPGDGLDGHRAAALVEDEARVDLELGGTGGEGTLAVLAASLVRRLVLTVSDVCDLVRDDVLGWTADLPADAQPAATTVRHHLVDAVTALWARPPGHPVVEPLTAGYRAWAATRPLPTPANAEVAVFLERIAALAEPARRAWQQHAMTLPRRSGVWSGAMHEASWAVVTAGRVREAAVHQLLAVELWDRVGFTAADAAEGLWNVVAGHVQALSVADVLADEHREILTGGGPPA